LQNFSGCAIIYVESLKRFSKQKEKHNFIGNPLVLASYMAKAVWVKIKYTTMEYNNYPQPAPSAETYSPVHLGHLGAISLVMVILLGISWMKNPQLFSFDKSKTAKASLSLDVPVYYAYVPSEELNLPLVAGASTDQGPSIINEDGSVSPAVDVGEVLGASTADVVLSLEDVQVKTVDDSPEAVANYFNVAKTIELGPVDDASFEEALSSGNQTNINSQAQKLTNLKDALQKLSVPQSLVRLQKLKIIQYTAAIGILQNFTQADENPELVGKYLGEFLKSQQDLDSENKIIAEKYSAEF